jgi:hypothetical protein
MGLGLKKALRQRRLRRVDHAVADTWLVQEIPRASRIGLDLSP